VIGFFILSQERFFEWDLIGPTRESIIERLNERVANETDYKDNHCNSKYLGGVKLSAVPLRQRAQTDKRNEHFAIDHSLDRASHAEANARKYERQRGRQQDSSKNLALAAAE
jgi:hypothetical protein